MPPTKQRKVWNEDLVTALRARAEIARQNGKRNSIGLSDAATAIESIRKDLYVFSTYKDDSRIVNFPTNKRALTPSILGLIHKIISGVEPVLPPGYVPTNVYEEQQRIVHGIAVATNNNNNFIDRIGLDGSSATTIHNNPYTNDHYLKTIKQRGGAYAILLAFYYSVSATMTKKQIINAAQPYCDEEMDSNFHAGRLFGAFKAVDTLVRHNLIIRDASLKRYNERAGGIRPLGPDKFTLTRDGELFIEALLEKFPTIQRKRTTFAGTTTPLAVNFQSGSGHRLGSLTEQYDGYDDDNDFVYDPSAFESQSSYVADIKHNDVSTFYNTNNNDEENDEERVREWILNEKTRIGDHLSFDVTKKKRQSFHNICDRYNETILLGSGKQIRHESFGTGRSRTLTITMMNQTTYAAGIALETSTIHNNNIQIYDAAIPVGSLWSSTVSPQKDERNNDKKRARTPSPQKRKLCDGRSTIAKRFRTEQLTPREAALQAAESRRALNESKVVMLDLSKAKPRSPITEPIVKSNGVASIKPDPGCSSRHIQRTDNPIRKTLFVHDDDNEQLDHSKDANVKSESENNSIMNPTNNPWAALCKSSSDSCNNKKVADGTTEAVVLLEDSDSDNDCKMPATVLSSSSQKRTLATTSDVVQVVPATQNRIRTAAAVARNNRTPQVTSSSSTCSIQPSFVVDLTTIDLTKVEEGNQDWNKSRQNQHPQKCNDPFRTEVEVVAITGTTATAATASATVATVGTTNLAARAVQFHNSTIVENHTINNKKQFIVYVDDRERNRNSTPRTIRMELTRLLVDGWNGRCNNNNPSSSYWHRIWSSSKTLDTIVPVVKERKLDHGDFLFSLKQLVDHDTTTTIVQQQNNDNDTNGIPVWMERKRIGDLVCRSYMKDHWYQLHSIRDMAMNVAERSSTVATKMMKKTTDRSGICFILLEGDIRTASIVPSRPYNAQVEDVRKPLSHTIDDEDTVWFFIGRAILSCPKCIRFHQSSNGQTCLRSIAAVASVCAATYNPTHPTTTTTDTSKKKKEKQRPQKHDRIALQDRLVRAGIPQRLAKYVSEEIGSEQQLDRLYQQCCTDLCRDQLLVHILSDADMEECNGRNRERDDTTTATNNNNPQWVRSSWSAAIHRCFYTAFAEEDNEMVGGAHHSRGRHCFDQCSTLVSDPGLLLATIHQHGIWNPEHAVDAFWNYCNNGGCDTNNNNNDDDDDIVVVDQPSWKCTPTRATATNNNNNNNKCHPSQTLDPRIVQITVPPEFEHTFSTSNVEDGGGGMDEETAVDLDHNKTQQSHQSLFYNVSVVPNVDLNQPQWNSTRLTIPIVTMQTQNSMFQSVRLVVFLLDGKEIVELLDSLYNNKNVNSNTNETKDCMEICHHCANQLKEECQRSILHMEDKDNDDIFILLISGLGNAIAQYMKQSSSREEMGAMTDIVLAEWNINHNLIVLQAIQTTTTSTTSRTNNQKNKDRDLILRQLAVACYQYQYLTKQKKNRQTTS